MNDKSNIQSIDYNSSKRLLNITLNSGEKLSYPDVPQIVYQGLLNSTYKLDYIDSLLEEYFDEDEDM